MQKILPLIIFFLPFFFALNPFPGIDLSIIRLLPILLLFYWFFENFKTKKFLLDKRLSFWFLILFLSLAASSFLWAENSAWSIRKSLFLISFLPFYFFSYSFFYQKNTYSLFQAFFLSAFVSSILGLFQFLSAFLGNLEKTLAFWNNFQGFFLGENFSASVLNYPSFLVNIGGQNFLRAFGTFPDPHLFGAYLTLSLPFGFYLYQNKKNFRYFWMTSLFLIFIVSLLSFSRTVYLMLLAELFFGLFFFFSQKNLLKILILFFTLIFPFFFFTDNPLKERFFSAFDFQEGSVSGRLLMWKKAVETFQKNPLVGVGLGNFPLIVNPQATLREPIYAHNLFLDFLVENGIFSFIFLFLLFLLPFLNNLFSKEKYRHTLAIFFLGFFIYALFEAPFFSLQLYPLFLIFLAL